PITTSWPPSPPHSTPSPTAISSVDPTPGRDAHPFPTFPEFPTESTTMTATKTRTMTDGEREHQLWLWEQLRSIANKLNTASESEEIAFLIRERMRLEAELQALTSAPAK